MMKRLTMAALVGGLIGTALSAQAGDSQNRIFHEKAFPITNGSQCQLKRFVLEVFENESTNLRRPGTFESVFTGAFVETTDSSCVHDYAVVQYIRGCAYNIDFDPVKKTYDSYFGQSRDSRGLEGVPFFHRTWDVDSVDLDPMYASSDDASTPAKRMGWQYTSKIPLQLNNSRVGMENDYKVVNQPTLRNFLQKSVPYTGTVTFTTDTPVGGNFDPRNEYDKFGKHWNVVNASMEFKTCVYRTKDIPTTGNPKGFDVSEANGGPMVCFDWNNKYNFDFATRSFSKDKFKGIDPFCATSKIDANLRDAHGRQYKSVNGNYVLK
jgi:hypothetical protein